MSTATVAPMAPPATPDAPRSPPPAAARWALARVEGRRLVTHPLVVLGWGASVLFAVLGASDPGGGIYALNGGAFSFVGAAIWVFIAASLAANRERRDAAWDFYGGQPLTPRLRTQAALLSVGWAGLAAAALTAVGALALAGTDLTLSAGDERYGLRPLDLLQGPAYVMFAGAAGVFVGSWTRRTYPSLIGGLVLFTPPVAWLPWFVYGADVPSAVWDGDWLANASVAWHLVGFAGLIALASAGALARHDRRPRIALLALVALAAAVAGIDLGWPEGR